MKKQKIYLDTSVIGGCYDKEFDDDSNKVIEMIKLNIYEGFVSSATIAELDDAPARVKKILEVVEFSILYLNDEIISLSEKYIKENIISEKFKRDCEHIALRRFIILMF